jgi:hypothetical protein
MYPPALPENHQLTRPHFYAAPDRRRSITDQQRNREDVGGHCDKSDPPQLRVAMSN